MNELACAERVALSQYSECEACSGGMRVASVIAHAAFWDVELVCKECERRLFVRVRPLDVAAYYSANCA